MDVMIHVDVLKDGITIQEMYHVCLYVGMG